MKYTDLANLLDHVRPHVPRAGEFTLLREVRVAAMEFCRRSEVWEHRVDFPDVVVGEPFYDLDTPGESEIQTFHHVWLEGDLEPLDLATEEDRLAYPDNGTVWGYLPVRGNGLYLVPPPQEARALHVKVSLIPTATATVIPQWLADRWGHGIASGALARILAIPGESTYRPDGVAYQRTLFDSAITDARGEREMGQSNGPIRGRIPKP